MFREKYDFPPALCKACVVGDLHRARSLYNRYIERDPPSRISILTQMAIESARNVHPEILSFCFASGLKERKSNCDDLLYAACSASHLVNDGSAIPVFAVLLDEGGSDVNHYLMSVGDVLCSAVVNGDIKLVKYLFSKGANPNSGLCHDQTDDEAVIAAINGDRNHHNTDMLKVLFEHGTSLRETGALIAAVEHGKLEAVKLIFQMRGDEVDLEDTEYYQFEDGTALYKAAAGGHAAIVDILVRTGADIGYTSSSDGQSVAEIAQTNGHTNLAVRLRQLMSLPPSAQEASRTDRQACFQSENIFEI
ncbi:MAG: hypothetical protein Q9169_008170 [Polycauliona sp. 2 TL-2023]